MGLDPSSDQPPQSRSDSERAKDKKMQHVTFRPPEVIMAITQQLNSIWTLYVGRLGKTVVRGP